MADLLGGVQALQFQTHLAHGVLVVHFRNVAPDGVKTIWAFHHFALGFFYAPALVHDAVHADD